jgi:hypothetical protein
MPKPQMRKVLGGFSAGPGSVPLEIEKDEGIPLALERESDVGKASIAGGEGIVGVQDLTRVLPELPPDVVPHGQEKAIPAVFGVDVQAAPPHVDHDAGKVEGRKLLASVLAGQESEARKPSGEPRDGPAPKVIDDVPNHAAFLLGLCLSVAYPESLVGGELDVSQLFQDISVRHYRRAHLLFVDINAERSSSDTPLFWAPGSLGLKW